MADIAVRSDLYLDPKRSLQKHADLVEAIGAVDHFKAGDVLRPVTPKLRKKASDIYRYVEIEKIYENLGYYVAADYLGWALPDCGKLI